MDSLGEQILTQILPLKSVIENTAHRPYLSESHGVIVKLDMFFNLTQNRNRLRDTHLKLVSQMNSFHTEFGRSLREHTTFFGWIKNISK